MSLILWLSCAPVRSLLALASVAALGAACAAGASPQKVDRADVHAAAARERLLGARLRHRREGRARPALRRRAGRPDPGAPERQAARDAAARHPPARHRRRRAGAARARVPPVLPEGAQALRPVHRPRRLDEARRVPDEREPRDARRGSSSRAATRTGTTTAACSRSPPTAASTSRWATAAPAAIRRTARRTCARSSASCSRSTSPRRGSRSRRSASATPGASRSTAPTATSTSATSARATWRRSTTCRRASPGLENYGWDVYEGRSRFEDKPLGTGQARRCRSRSTRHDERLLGHGRLRLPRLERLAARPLHLRRLLQRDTSGASRSPAARRPGLRRERFKIESVTSFGQDIAGELYGVSHGGTIYRLTP